MIKTEPLYILIDIGEGDAFYGTKENYIGQPFTFYTKCKTWYDNKWYHGEIVFKENSLNIQTQAHPQPHVSFYQFKFIKFPCRKKTFLRKYGMLLFDKPDLFNKLYNIMKEGK